MARPMDCRLVKWKIGDTDPNYWNKQKKWTSVVVRRILPYEGRCPRGIASKVEGCEKDKRLKMKDERLKGGE